MAPYRLLIRRIHLWLGLSLGLVFAVIGLTGSALVFYVGIDNALHPATRAAAGEAAPDWREPVWDRALATGRGRWNDPGGRWSLEVTGEGGAIPARYYAATGHHADRQMVWFSPDGARILRAEPWGGYLMSFLYQLHMELLAGEAGLQFVGWAGVALLLLLVTGLIAWWPRGSWAKALAFKRGAAPIRRLRDWHKLTGLWSLILLLILVATGVLLALPVVTRALFAPAALAPPAVVERGGRRISVVEAFAAARGAIPGGRIVFVDVPDRGDAPIRVRMQAPGEPHGRFPASYVFVDPESAKVLAVQDYRRGGIGTLAAGWIRPLHDGSVAGLPTRILAVLMGFAPAILFATGLFHWLRRRRARQQA